MNSLATDIALLFSMAQLGFFWRCRCCAATAYLYNCAGYEAPGVTRLKDVHGYDPNSNGWTAFSSMPNPTRSSHNCASVPSLSLAYAVAGATGAVTSLQDNDEYDLGGDSWASRTSLPSPARNRACAVGFGELVYCIMGQQSPSVYDDNDEYDISGDSWTARTGEGTGRFSSANFTTPDDVIHIVAGRASGGTYLNDNDGYDPAGDSWDIWQNIVSPSRDSLIDGGMVSALGYVLGGNSSGGLLADNDEYDYSGDSWSSKTSMSDSRSFVGVRELDSYVYALTGVTASSPYTANNRQYDPSGDSYTDKASYTGGSGAGVTEGAPFT